MVKHNFATVHEKTSVQFLAVLTSVMGVPNKPIIASGSQEEFHVKFGQHHLEKKKILKLL